MNSSYILNNVLKNYKNKININNLNIFFQPLIFFITSTKKKYMHFFVKMFVNSGDNIFVSYLFLPSHKNEKENEKKDLLIEIFIKILKTYNAMRKLLNIFKKSKYVTVIETDLLLNNISLKNKNVICVVQNKKKYLFYIFELSKIIYNSLSNSTFFMSEPLEIKNPYNNLRFEYHNLCNIYFFMKFNGIYFNEIFYKYFKSNFNIKLFLHRNFNLLRQCSINNFINNHIENDYLYEDIMNMINNYNSRINKEHRILISEEFPKNILYNIMNKYLLLFINVWYSYVEYECESYLKELNHRLYYFQAFNPQFGRLKYKITKNYCFYKKRHFIKIEKTFDSKHIPFVHKINMNFDGHYKYVNLCKSHIESITITPLHI